MLDFVVILFSSVLVNNYVLVQTLGGSSLCGERTSHAGERIAAVGERRRGVESAALIPGGHRFPLLPLPVGGG